MHGASHKAKDIMVFWSIRDAKVRTSRPENEPRKEVVEEYPTRGTILASPGFLHIRGRSNKLLSHNIMTITIGSESNA